MLPSDKDIYQQLPAIVKRYQLPNSRKATIQILNSFLPFMAIWIAMYVWRDVSIWLTIGLAVVNAFSFSSGFLSSSTTVGTSRSQIRGGQTTSSAHCAVF